MIVESLLNAIISIVGLLFGLINLPPTDPTTLAAFDSIVGTDTVPSVLDYAKTFIPLFLPIDLSVYINGVIILFTVDFSIRPIKYLIRLIRGM